MLIIWVVAILEGPLLRLLPGLFEGSAETRIQNQVTRLTDLAAPIRRERHYGPLALWQDKGEMRLLIFSTRISVFFKLAN